MSDAVVVAMIAAIPPTLVGLAALISSWYHRKCDRDDHKRVGHDVSEIKRLMNGKARE